MRWRNNDCRSRAFAMGVGLLQYSKDFDKPFAGGFGAIFNVVFRVGFSSFSIYKTVDTCTKQYAKYIRDDPTPWTKDYNLMAELEAEEDERRQL